MKLSWPFFCAIIARETEPAICNVTEISNWFLRSHWDFVVVQMHKTRFHRYHAWCAYVLTFRALHFLSVHTRRACDTLLIQVGTQISLPVLKKKMLVIVLYIEIYRDLYFTLSAQTHYPGRYLLLQVCHILKTVVLSQVGPCAPPLLCLFISFTSAPFLSPCPLLFFSCSLRPAALTHNWFCHSEGWWITQL